MAAVQPTSNGYDHDGLVDRTNSLKLDDHNESDNVPNGHHPNGIALGSALATDPEHLRDEDRPQLPKEPSRSYIKPIPIVTTYMPEENEPTPAKRRSEAGSTRAQSLKAPSVKAASAKPASVKRASSVREAGEDDHYTPVPRPASRAGSTKSRSQGAAVGDVMSPERQRQLQGISLHDSRPTTTFDEPQRAASPRPGSAFGYRPQPNLVSVAEEGRDSRYDGRESRAGQLDRSGTVLSRANTLGRNGTLSRAANGGTVGSRRGAFGRGAGASIGTQPEEVLGRDDIHARAELSERILDDATLRRLSMMEKKDAKRLSKVIKSEGKAEAAAVKASIKELERLSKLQKEAAYAERKSQLRLSKYTSKEHKARLRFLKEKERYEKIEGELRNAENDYEERRDHAAGLTAQVAEKTQELDDLRGQKAADDREREVKLLALKNPGHS